MANSRKRSNKPASVAQFPQPSSAVAVEDVPEAFQEPAEAAPPAPTAPTRSLNRIGIQVAFIFTFTYWSLYAT